MESALPAKVTTHGLLEGGALCGPLALCPRRPCSLQGVGTGGWDWGSGGGAEGTVALGRISVHRKRV